MAKDKTNRQAPADRYCRTCQHNLRGLPEPRCPECGNPFDPNDPHTFLRNIKSTNRRRLLRRICIILATPAVLVAICYAGWIIWLRLQWNQEQAAIQTLTSLGATIEYANFEGEWERRFLPRHYAPPIRHARAVDLHKGNPKTKDLEALHNLPYLTVLMLHGSNVNDSTLRLVSNPKRLRVLSLEETGIDDAGLKYLASFPALESLEITASYDRISKITAAGLSNIRGLKNLRTLSILSIDLHEVGVATFGPSTTLTELDLAGANLTDDGLAGIGAFPALTTVDISENPVTDVGLQHLQSLQMLTTLLALRTNFTPEGLQKLQASRPRLRIYDQPER